MRNERLRALVELGRELEASGYEFTTVTPETHRRVNARAPALATDARGVFGWSRPFRRGAISDGMIDLLRAAVALRTTEAGAKSAVRVSTLGGRLFVHSAYPTTDADAVFFGPDTYRFCAAIQRASIAAARVVDIGCGSGAGGLVAGLAARRLVLADVNEEALLFAEVNLALAGGPGTGRDVEVVRSDVLASVEGEFDLVVANPPYMKDEQGRTYRDGGGRHGEALSIRIAEEALTRLAPGGTLLLYTGVPMSSAHGKPIDPFFGAVAPLVEGGPFRVRYEEIDPDVFGEELDRPGYEDVERIAAVVLTVTRAA
jgi:methylase of polypeptide subunit release factors